MAPTQAQIACGTTFAFSTDGGTTFETVDEFVSIGDLGTTGEFVDVTRLDSADCTREYIGGLLDPADKELMFHFLPDDVNQQLLITAALARQTVEAQIDIPTLDVRFTFAMALSGRRIVALAPNEAVDFVISGKESGPLTEETPIPAP